MKAHLLWIKILFSITGDVLSEAINSKLLTNCLQHDLFQSPRSVLAELPRMRMVTEWHPMANPLQQQAGKIHQSVSRDVGDARARNLKLAELVVRNQESRVILFTLGSVGSSQIYQ